MMRFENKSATTGSFVEAACVMLVLLIGYAVAFSNIVSFDCISVAWALVSVYVIFRVKPLPIILSVIFYLFLLVAYGFGVAAVKGNPDSLAYAKNIASSFFLTSLVLGILTGQLRKSGAEFARMFLGKRTLQIGFAVVAAWAYFIFSTTKAGGGYVVKEYGGMNYLTTSDILAIAALIAIESGAVGIRWRFAFFVVTLVALFFLGSRATIVIFIICLMCSSGPGTSLGKRVSLSLIICAISLIGFYFTINYAGEELSYRLISLMEMDGDGSRVTRAMFQDRFISRLGDEPLCLIYPCFPQEGEYAHNILSVQQYFGVVGSLLIGGLFINFVMTRLRGARTPLVATMMFCLLMMLLARAWLSLVFPILSAYLLSAILPRNIRI